MILLKICDALHQVLAEFAATLLHKMIPAARPTAHGVYGIHFYDAMIIAAAERGGCARIWSEDLNAGQEYFGIPVRNPFL